MAADILSAAGSGCSANTGNEGRDLRRFRSVRNKAAPPCNFFSTSIEMTSQAVCVCVCVCEGGERGGSRER